MTDRPPEPSYEPGDRVIDALQERDPTETANPLVVLRVHDDRADEWTIEELDGMTVAMAAIGWPSSDPDPDYDADADRVVEAVFESDLDEEYGTKWTNWDTAELYDRVAGTESVRTYAYHARRLKRVVVN